jgi:hypothetical protein
MEDIESGRYSEASREVAREMVMIERIKSLIGSYRR